MTIIILTSVYFLLSVMLIILWKTQTNWILVHGAQLWVMPIVDFLVKRLIIVDGEHLVDSWRDKISSNVLPRYIFLFWNSLIIQTIISSLFYRVNPPSTLFH